MNFTFYNQLISQPDIEEIAPKIQPSLNVLDLLYSKLHDLPPKDLNTASFAEVSSKVENLINKHFPNLVHDYCKLSLEYRNTVVIKKEQSKGQLKQYTAKDILLNNLNKLIEEIHVLDNEFNENYTHKLLVQKRLVDKMGVQKDIIQVKSQNIQTEIEEDCNTSHVENFNYVQLPPLLAENEKVVNPVINTSPNASLTSISLLEIILALTIFTMMVIIGSFIYAKKQNDYNLNTEMVQLTKLQSNIKELYGMQDNYNSLNMDVLKQSRIIVPEKLMNNKYINSFSGETTITPYTQKQKNDSFLIENSDIPQEQCMKMAMQLGESNSVVIVNKKTIKESIDTKIDIGNLITACDHDFNTIGMVN